MSHYKYLPTDADFEANIKAMQAYFVNPLPPGSPKTDWFVGGFYRGVSYARLDQFNACCKAACEYCRGQGGPNLDVQPKWRQKYMGDLGAFVHYFDGAEKDYTCCQAHHLRLNLSELQTRWEEEYGAESISPAADQ